jgi:hypothetical protein
MQDTLIKIFDAATSQPTRLRAVISIFKERFVIASTTADLSPRSKQHNE